MIFFFNIWNYFLLNSYLDHEHRARPGLEGLCVDEGEERRGEQRDGRLQTGQQGEYLPQLRLADTLRQHRPDDDGGEGGEEAGARSDKQNPAVPSDTDDDQADNLGAGCQQTHGSIVDLPVETEERHHD